MLKVNDQIKIVKAMVGGEDIFVLSQMYMPLIGIDGFSLYLTINNIKAKDNIIFVKKILDLMSFSNVGVLDDTFKKLEAIGLVKRFYNENKSSCNYLFEMQTPLDGKSFLKNELLKNYLKSAIGEVEYKYLKNVVFKEKYSGYSEVSKRFDEMFETSEKRNYHIEEIVKKNISDNIRVKNDKFDYTLFKLMFDTNFIDERVLDDEMFSKEILRISYQYQLNEEEMKEAVIKAITIGNDLKIEDVSKYAGYIYQNKNVEKPLVFKTKEAVSYNEGLSSEELDFINEMESQTPSQLLSKMSGGKAAVSEIRNFEKVASETGLSDSVINVLITYIVFNKEGEIPSYSYIEKIAKTWVRANIKTAYDALKYINKPADSKTSKTVSRKTKKNSEWVNEYMNDLKDESSSEISDEEKEQGLDAADKLFG